MTSPTARREPAAGAASRSRVVLIAAGFAGLGLPLGALGVAWPAIQHDFDQPASHLAVVVIGNLGLLVVGLGMSAVFPTLIAVTPSRVGAARAPTAIGFQVAGAALGAVALAVAFGVLAVHAGLEVLGPVLVGSALALTALCGVLERVAPPRERRVRGGSRAPLGEQLAGP